MIRRLVPIALASLCAVGALAPVAAHASHTQATSFEAPRDLLDPAQRETAFTDIAGFGVRSLRIVLYWKDVAPNPKGTSKPTFDQADPSEYDWSKYDPAIDEAAARGWSVILTVSGPVPYWATLARRDDRTRPSPEYFQRFMTAVGRHYGSKVETYSIWNEPNLPRFLLPQYFKHQVASPAIYRKLWLAGYRGLQQAGIVDPQVLLGETEPRKTSVSPAPLLFLRGVLCLDSKYQPLDKNCAKLPVAGIADHAYTTKQGPFFVPPNADDVTIGVLGRLVSAMRKFEAAGAIPKDTPIYLTEFGIQSVPDTIYGVSEQRQAEYQAISEYLAWQQPRVTHFSQYLLRDDLPLTGVPESEKYGGFESGLEYADGKKKKSFRGFPVPLAALRSADGEKVTLWGLARPADGPTKVSVWAGTGAMKPYATYQTDSHGYFTATVPYVKGRDYRLQWTSPEGRLYRGVITRVYERPKSS
ncbi:MAG TPA: hypothetical protein VHB30_03095 [Solirubrobacteraceae bacterium]|jgi:hypothetical protein|nr:hypothetical protein [Solirubrobacteraceae bacterium]